jgi:hypothetical protein
VDKAPILLPAVMAVQAAARTAQHREQAIPAKVMTAAMTRQFRESV